MSNVSKLKKKAADLEQKKQFDRAVQAYIELLDALAHDIDDADIPLYNRVGDLLIRQNSAAEALVYYEKAVDLYSERGFLNNAIALCNKILRQSPGRTVIYYKLGKISASKGFKSDAKRNFLEYADRMEKGGKRDEAFRALKEFADLCPDQDDVRLMLAENLARDHRRDEAIEQLQTLHARLETEGRQAEARATLDRMKAIDPDVEPRPSGSYQHIKSNELVFLDVDDMPSRRGPQTPSEPVPSARAPQPELEDDAFIAPEPPLATQDLGLDGLGLTLVPEEETGDATSADLIDGFTPTADRERIITPGGVAPVEDLVTDRQEPPDIHVAFPSLIDVPVVEEMDAEEMEAARIELESFADETLSETEFAELQLEPLDEPLEERPHDLALPSDLPLLRFTDEVPIIVDGLSQPAGGGGEGRESASDVFDLNTEIMSPISRSQAASPAIDDQAFDLEEAVGESLDDAAAALDESPVQHQEPNEQPAAVAEVEREVPTAESEATPPAASEPTHSLEWEDLAAAAAAHDVEPLELPAPASSAAPSVSESEPEIDPHFLDRAPTFGREAATGDSDFAPMPLSPDTLEPDPLVGSDHRAPISEGDGAVPGALADDHPRTQRRTPPRALEAHTLVDALREQLQAAPNDARLRRRLAEAILETGDRERGLRELDAAMQGVEEEGDLETARDIANEILRLAPESVRHHQKCVEYAVRSGDRMHLIEAYVELANALFRSGEHDKASAVYGRVVELEPNDTRALHAIEILAGRSPSEATARGAAHAAARPGADNREVGDPSFDELDFEDLDAEVAAAFQSPDEDGDGQGFGDRSVGTESDSGGFAAPALVSRASDFVDLGAMLRGDQPSKSTRMVVDATPTGDEQADFEDMLRRFKQGVAANVDDEDFDSHYDLGVAFKEMGLIDDAIAQFQKALRSDSHRSRAYEALGQCFIEKNQHQVAATLLARAVETTRVDDRVLVGCLYLLAYACEHLQRDREALVYYHRVFAVDVDFRDVATRIRSLESQAAT